MAFALTASRNGAAVRSRAVPAGGNVVEYGARRAIVTAAIVIATLLEIVDVTIVNVALPNIQGNFGAGVDQAAWIGTGYIIANVVVIPMTPWLQMRFGRREYYAASIALFTFASLMCGLAGSLSALIVWRVVQGLGGGGLISTSQAILRETYPATEQGKAAAIFSMGVIVGPTLGPMLGGIVTDNLSWRWAFFINLPLGLLALSLVMLYLRNPRAPQRMSFDARGLALLVVGIGSLQYVLDQGQQKDWFDDRSILTCTVTAVVGIAAFVVWQLRSARPLVDLRVLRYRSVAAGSALGLVLGISLYGSVLILPQYVQGTLGYTATLSGELLVVRALAVLVLTPIAAMVATSRRIDARILIGSGFVLLGVSNLMLAGITTADTPFWSFAGALLVSGIGLALIFVPLTVGVLGSVPPKDIPAAAAFFNLSRQIGGSIAIAVLITILVRATVRHHADLAGAMNLASPAVSQYLAARGGPNDPAARGALDALVGTQATVLAYADTARATALITFALVPCVLLMRRPTKAVAIASE